MRLILKGRIPSKKNSRIIVCRGRFPMSLPSKSYTEWHKEQSQTLPKINTIDNCKMVITFYAPDKRPTDLSNKAESIMDLLVDNKILKDDNWFVVSSLSLILGGIDKDNPRAEIDINIENNN